VNDRRIGGRVPSRGRGPRPRKLRARTPDPTPPARDAPVIWHELECGSYSADLAVWEELADEASTQILDLGCGTGRVALHLAQRGHRVLGLDADEDLIAVLRERAVALPVEAEVGDARDFELGVEFGLVLAPMQLVQLLAGAEERRRCLECVASHLADGGIAAFAMVESMPMPVDPSPPLPDAREVDGWVYSSLPLDAAVDATAIRVRRLRQTVSPAGELSEEIDELRLRRLDAAELEGEAAEVGLRQAGRREIPPTRDHVGSTVVLLEKEA
jgi:SAM-dependent methyltransferase